MSPVARGAGMAAVTAGRPPSETARPPHRSCPRLQLGTRVPLPRRDPAGRRGIPDRRRRQREATRRRARAARAAAGARVGRDELRWRCSSTRARIANLERNDPARGLDAANFADFCLAVEGVSHFVYVALCAAAERRVSALELELQAEVDKFACCVLLRSATARAICRRRLFRDVSFADDLSRDERERYRTANRRPIATQAVSRPSWRRTAFRHADELRRFYRLALDDKLATSPHAVAAVWLTRRRRRPGSRRGQVLESSPHSSARGRRGMQVAPQRCTGLWRIGLSRGGCCR